MCNTRVRIPETPSAKYVRRRAATSTKNGEYDEIAHIVKRINTLIRNNAESAGKPDTVASFSGLQRLIIGSVDLFEVSIAGKSRVRALV
jgi:hypothetical protein